MSAEEGEVGTCNRNRKGGRPWWIFPAMSRHLVRASCCCIITTSDVESSDIWKKHVSDPVPDPTRLGSIAVVVVVIRLATRTILALCHNRPHCQQNSTMAQVPEKVLSWLYSVLHVRQTAHAFPR